MISVTFLLIKRIIEKINILLIKKYKVKCTKKIEQSL